MNVDLPTELSLFSGAGGGILAARILGHRVVCYVEREPYCVKVLRARISDQAIDDAPIWDDARTFDGRSWRGVVDIVSAGFPCQPFSMAGRRRAGADERNMWSDTIRIIREVRPGVAFLENVPGLLARSHGYFGTILGDLAAIGYDARWICLSAAECGAPHRRKRLWILATDTERNKLRHEHRRKGRANWECASEPRDDGEARLVADTDRSRCSCLQGSEEESEGARVGIVNGCGWWTSELNVGRVAHGVAARVDRLRAIGNGQVPIVAATAFRYLEAPW